MSWLRTMVIPTAFGLALGCSDPVPGETGGAGNGGTAGAGGATGEDAGAGAAGGGGGTAGAGGGTGGSDGGADAGLTAEKACEHLARVSCEKYNECLPWYVPLNFGDTETCVAQYVKTTCLNRVGLEDTVDTPESREACAAARTAATCAQWFNNDIAVSACLDQPGKRGMGAVCDTSAQCQTNRCDISSGSSCGFCGAPLVGAGGTCFASSDCASNLQCFSGTCGLPRGLGEPCTTQGACQYEYLCVNSRCAAPGKAGEACTTTPGATPCNSRAGLFCRPSTGVCEAYRYANPGEACDRLEGPFCRRSSQCKTAAGSTTGVCSGGALEGEACDDFTGPICVPFGKCVQGVCKVPEFGVCR